jgi:hypothetical protein
VTNIKNEYEIRGDTAVIFIKRRDGTIFETEISINKLQFVIDSYKGKWAVNCCKQYDKFYVVGSNRSAKKIHLHRLLTNCPDGMVVDHIDGNSLNNKDNNLRIVTQGQNRQNINGLQKNNTSGVRGVSWNNSSGRWQVRFRINKKDINVGYYIDFEEAKKVALDSLKKYLPFAN